MNRFTLAIGAFIISLGLGFGLWGRRAPVEQHLSTESKPTISQTAQVQEPSGYSEAHINQLTRQLSKAMAEFHSASNVKSADEALLMAATVAEQIPEGARTVTGEQNVCSGPEGGARLLLKVAHSEYMQGRMTAYKRHLGLILKHFAQKSPSIARQARGELGLIPSHEIRVAKAQRRMTAASRETPEQIECQRTTFLPATADKNMIIFSGAKAGVTYQISASGYWAPRSEPEYWSGPEGTTSHPPIWEGEFTGMLFGTFAVLVPGSETWAAVGASGTITPTEDGDIYGSFADLPNLWFDNHGACGVVVIELPCEDPPLENMPPEAFGEATPSLIAAGNSVTLDATPSYDADGFVYHFSWRYQNLSQPLQPFPYRAIESSDPAVTVTMPEAGEYEIELIVYDDLGLHDTTTMHLTVAGVEFSTNSLTINEEQTTTLTALTLPDSILSSVSFTFSPPGFASVTPTSPLASNEVLSITGVAEGTTVLHADMAGLGSLAQVGIQVVKPASIPPTAIASASKETIPVGGFALLDGSLSHDNDENEESIVLWSWHIDNTTTPEDDGITVERPDAMLNHQFFIPGTYQITLTVVDDEGDPSPDGSTDAHLTIDVVGVTFEPEALSLRVGESLPVTATIVPESAVAEVVFSVADTSLASSDKSVATLPTETFQITGLSEGQTSFIAEIPGETPHCGTAALFLLTTHIPTAVAIPRNTIIPVGETISLDGSASRDNDTLSDEPNLPEIVKYEWKLENQVAPNNVINHPTTKATDSVKVDVPGDYVVSLVVLDNDGQRSEGSTAQDHYSVKVVKVTVTGIGFSIEVGQTADYILFTEPASAVEDVVVEADGTAISMQTFTPTSSPYLFHVTGVNAGSAKIIARLKEDSAEVGTATITVTPKPVGEISMTPEVGAVAARGGELTMTVSTDSPEVAGVQITSSNSSIVRVRVPGSRVGIAEIAPGQPAVFSVIGAANLGDVTILAREFGSGNAEDTSVVYCSDLVRITVHRPGLIGVQVYPPDLKPSKTVESDSSENSMNVGHTQRLTLRAIFEPELPPGLPVAGRSFEWRIRDAGESQVNDVSPADKHEPLAALVIKHPSPDRHRRHRVVISGVSGRRRESIRVFVAPQDTYLSNGRFESEKVDFSDKIKKRFPLLELAEEAGLTVVAYAQGRGRFTLETKTLYSSIQNSTEGREWLADRIRELNLDIGVLLASTLGGKLGKVTTGGSADEKLIAQIGFLLLTGTFIMDSITDPSKLKTAMSEAGGVWKVDVEDKNSVREFIERLIRRARLEGGDEELGTAEATRTYSFVATATTLSGPVKIGSTDVRYSSLQINDLRIKFEIGLNFEVPDVLGKIKAKLLGKITDIFK